MHSSSCIATIFSDIIAAAFSWAVCGSVITFSKKKYDSGLFDVHAMRKLIHAGVGLLLLLFWPMFSCGTWGATMAGLVPSLCMTKAFLRIHKNDKFIQSLGRFRDTRDLVVAALGYMCTVAFATVYYWKASPIGFAAICNLCAGDAMADFAGRRLGRRWKLPYNKDKSFAGTIAMAVAGFLASTGYMQYFSWLGYVEASHNTFRGFLVASLVSALVESLPMSSPLDDNLTVPVASMLVGAFVF